jgi:hypothetical protein
VGRFLRTAAWWLLGAGFVAAPLADLLVKPSAAQKLARSASDVDPNVRWMGNVQMTLEVVADALPAGRTFRDIEFFLDAPSMIEIIARGDGTPLELVLFNPVNEQVASAHVAAGGEGRLEGLGGYGSRNRIRVRRIGPETDRSVPFQLQVRRRP